MDKHTRTLMIMKDIEAGIDWSYEKDNISYTISLNNSPKAIVRYKITGSDGYSKVICSKDVSYHIYKLL